ncbi:MAG: hypothetical protein R3B70_31045 [Polyangiaceae bacterium]
MRLSSLLAGSLAGAIAAGSAVTLAQQPPAPSPPPPKPSAPAPAKKTAAAATAAPPVKRAASVARAKKGKRAPDGGPIVTYPGFRMLDGGGSRVLVTIDKKVAITESKAEGKLTYHIPGAQVPTRTNRLPLVTTFFDTPVSRAVLVEHETGVDLVIELRAPTTAQYRVIETDKGAELQVDFPKQDPPADKPAESAAADAPAAKTASPTTAPKSLDTGAGTAY